MFWKKKPKLPITPEDQIWVEESLSFLKESLGEDCLLAVETVTPTKTFFNRDFDGSEEDAQFILGRCQELMDIPKGKVSLDFYSEEAHYLDDGTLLSSSADIMGRSKGAAGTYQKSGGKSLIRIERGQLKHPESLIATISHELAHEKLLGENRIIENDEYLTDLTAIAFGFGIFIANAKFQFQSGLQNGFGWQMQSQGYLPEQITAYAMASLAIKKNEEKTGYKSYLSGGVEKYFQESITYLQSDTSEKNCGIFWVLPDNGVSNLTPKEELSNAKAITKTESEGNNILGFTDLENTFVKACANNDMFTVIHCLEQGVSPNTVGNYGIGGLTKAISNHNFEIADVLLQKGADINYIKAEDSIFNQTILVSLCGEKDIESIKYALAMGADPNLFSKMGGYALFEIIEEKEYRNKNTVLDIEIVELLLSYGAHLEVRDSIYRNETPLCKAVKQNNKEMVLFLLSKGAKSKPLRKMNRKDINPKMVKFLKTKKYL